MSEKIGEVNYYTQHHYVEPRRFKAVATAERFGAAVGIVEVSTEREIVGRNGEHLQFYVEAGASGRYQVDVNIQSSNGTPIEVYIGGESLNSVGTVPDEPFGSPQYGVFFDASLSYAGLGLTDAIFQPVSAPRIQSQLEAAFSQAVFVAVYGLVFDDGGPNGKGIHATHFDPTARGAPNADGAVVVYAKDSAGNPGRTWFFFKFAEDNIKQ